MHVKIVEDEKDKRRREDEEEKANFYAKN